MLERLQNPYHSRPQGRDRDESRGEGRGRNKKSSGRRHKFPRGSATMPSAETIAQRLCPFCSKVGSESDTPPPPPHCPPPNTGGAASAESLFHPPADRMAHVGQPCLHSDRTELFGKEVLCCLFIYKQSLSHALWAHCATVCGAQSTRTCLPYSWSKKKERKRSEGGRGEALCAPPQQSREIWTRAELPWLLARKLRRWGVVDQLLATF